MTSRIIILGFLAVLACGFSLTGCDGARQEPPPQRGGLQIEIERDPKEDGGGVKVKINKPENDESKKENGAKGDENSFGGVLWAVIR